MDEDADASMQRLLAEAYDEFELEEPAEIPGSVFVERCPEEETVTEKTVKEETVSHPGANTAHRSASIHRRRATVEPQHIAALRCQAHEDCVWAG
jgi:hypothetical protein